MTTHKFRVPNTRLLLARFIYAAPDINIGDTEKSLTLNELIDVLSQTLNTPKNEEKEAPEAVKKAFAEYLGKSGDGDPSKMTITLDNIYTGLIRNKHIPSNATEDLQNSAEAFRIVARHLATIKTKTAPKEYQATYKELADASKNASALLSAIADKASVLSILPNQGHDKQ